MARRRETTVPEAVERYLDASVSGTRFVVALSGGPDSTALFAALVDAGARERLVGAHVQHSLRGEESREDETFVRELCDRAGVPLFVLDGALERRTVRQEGTEAAARRVRYERLRALRDALGVDRILTAHTRDDQAETVLLRLLTGSGPRRLAGIDPRTSDGIDRPLLEVSRAAVEVYLEKRGLEPRRDSSNRDLRFLRNRIRSELVPLLRRWNPRVDALLAETARQERERERMVSAWLDAASAGLVVRAEGEVRLDVRGPLLDGGTLRAVLRREIDALEPGSRTVGAESLERATGAMLGVGNVRAITLTKGIRLEHRPDCWMLLRTRPRSEPFRMAIEPGQAVSLPEGARMALVELSETGEPSRERGGMRQRFQLPEGGTGESFFEVRTRRRGDRFHPIGLPAPKNLGDFLSNRKIPREQRDRLALLVWRGEIVWIAGVEVGERFRVRNPRDSGFEVLVEYES